MKPVGLRTWETQHKGRETSIGSRPPVHHVAACGRRPSSLCPTFAQLQCTLILEARRKGKCCLSPKSHALQLFSFVSRQSMMPPPVYNFVFQPTSLYGLSHCCCRPTSLPPLMVLLCTILLLGQHVPISSRVSPYCSDSPMVKIN